MYTMVKCVHAGTKYVVALAGIQFFDVNENICGGGALVLAVNMMLGQTTDTEISFSCNGSTYVATYNYKTLAGGKTGTVQSPKRPIKPGAATLGLRFVDAARDSLDEFFVDENAIVVPVLEVREE